MNRLLDDDDDLLQQRDRELTLSTGAILAIFLGLVLLCAIFFGFGYNLGRKATPASPPIVTSEPASPAAATSTNFNSFKPSPSSLASSSLASSSPAAASTGSGNTTTVAVPTEPAPPAPTPSTATHPVATATRTVPPVTAPAPHESVVPPHTSAPALAHPTASTPASAPAATAPAGAFVVQVAAVSRKDDADLLVSALHAKGYDVVARPGSQDKLLHIQVGPFATRKDAEAMREKLIIDGYNAIVK
jgi:cell division septation protein DedD